MDLANLTLDIDQHVDVKRPAGDVFEAMLDQLTTGFRYPDGRSMDMHLERRPGGRWYRDLGEDTGHLWGFVQTFKPPMLLEITGPFFMSYPAVNYLEIKVVEVEGGARLSLRHRALGLLLEDHVKGVSQGWGQMINGVKQALES